jgi:cytochrome c553
MLGSATSAALHEPRRTTTRRRPFVKRITPLLAALLAGGAPIAGAQGGEDLARSLAATCANCHGTGGQARGAVPSLAGQPKADIVQKMNDFRDGKRQATIMHQLAKGYTPAQVDAIAGWFAAQKK